MIAVTTTVRTVSGLQDSCSIPWGKPSMSLCILQKKAVEEASSFNGHNVTMTLYVALRVALGYGLSFSLYHVPEDHAPTLITVWVFRQEACAEITAFFNMVAGSDLMLGYMV